MTQEPARVPGYEKRTLIEIILAASAVADGEIDTFGGRNPKASAKSAVRREARTACGLVALQKRRAVTGGARSVLTNPAVYRLRSPWRDIEGRRCYAKPINNVIHGSCLEVAEFSLATKPPLTHYLL